MAKGGSTILTRLALRMVLVTLVAGIAAAVFAMQLPTSFRARALLILAPQPFELKDEVPGSIGAIETQHRRVSFMKVNELEVLAMPDYELLFQSEEIVAKLRDRMRELYLERNLDPGELTIEKVKRSLDVNTSIELTTVEEVVYQQVAELMLTSGDPVVSAELTNYWIELVIELAERMRAAGSENAVAILREQLEDSEALLDAARAKLEELDSKHNVRGLAERLARREAALTEFQIDRTRLRMDLARAQGQLSAQADREDDSESMRESRAQQRMWMESEVPAKQAELEALDAALADLEAETAELRAQVAQFERERADYELEIKNLEFHINETVISLRDAELISRDLGPEFKIASRAVPPEEKVAPHRSLIVLVAVFLAAVAVPVHFFGMHALRRYARIIEEEERG